MNGTVAQTTYYIDTNYETPTLIKHTVFPSGGIVEEYIATMSDDTFKQFQQLWPDIKKVRVMGQLERATPATPAAQTTYHINTNYEPLTLMKGTAFSSGGMIEEYITEMNVNSDAFKQLQQLWPSVKKEWLPTYRDSCI